MSRCLSHLVGRVAAIPVAALALFAAFASLAAPSVAQLGAFHQDALLASNASSFAEFGRSTAMDGETVVVGAPYADATDVGSTTGAAYVYLRVSGSWTEQARLESSVGEMFEEFGDSVAISGDTVVVGAPSADTGAGFDAGYAAVFVRNSFGTWSQQALLYPDDAEAGDFFGRRVAISGDTIAVGSPYHGVGAGAVYVFVRSGTVWTQQAQLTTSDAAPDDHFGLGLAVAGDTIIAGATHDSNEIGPFAGAAYVFTRSGTSWSEQAKLLDPLGNTSNLFGWAIAISGETAVISSFAEVVGGYFSAGSVSVFVRSGTSWSHQAKLTAADPDDNSELGTSVAISGNVVVAGAARDTNENGIFAGAAYVFARTGTSWSQELKLIHAKGSDAEGFGQSVAVRHDTVVVGIPGDLTFAGYAGSTDVFRLQGDWTNLGFGLAGINGVPMLVGTGVLVAGTPGKLTLSGANDLVVCMLFISLASTPTPFKGGTLAAFPPALTLSMLVPPGGSLPLSFTWPSGLPSGTSLYFQYAISDVIAVGNVALSNAVRGKTP